jgi:hypothetical protein
MMLDWFSYRPRQWNTVRPRRPMVVRPHPSHHAEIDRQGESNPTEPTPQLLGQALSRFRTFK